MLVSTSSSTHLHPPGFDCTSEFVSRWRRDVSLACQSTRSGRSNRSVSRKQQRGGKSCCTPLSTTCTRQGTSRDRRTERSEAEERPRRKRATTHPLKKYQEAPDDEPMETERCVKETTVSPLSSPLLESTATTTIAEKSRQGDGKTFPHAPSRTFSILLSSSSPFSNDDPRDAVQPSVPPHISVPMRCCRQQQAAPLFSSVSASSSSAVLAAAAPSSFFVVLTCHEDARRKRSILRACLFYSVWLPLPRGLGENLAMRPLTLLGSLFSSLSSSPSSTCTEERGDEGNTFPSLSYPPRLPLLPTTVGTAVHAVRDRSSSSLLTVHHNPLVEEGEALSQDTKRRRRLIPPRRSQECSVTKDADPSGASLASSSLACSPPLPPPSLFPSLSTCTSASSTLFSLFSSQRWRGVFGQRFPFSSSPKFLPQWCRVGKVFSSCRRRRDAEALDGRRYVSLQKEKQRKRHKSGDDVGWRWWWYGWHYLSLFTVDAFLVFPIEVTLHCMTRNDGSWWWERRTSPTAASTYRQQWGSYSGSPSSFPLPPTSSSLYRPHSRPPSPKGSRETRRRTLSVRHHRPSRSPGLNAGGHVCPSEGEATRARASSTTSNAVKQRRKPQWRTHGLAGGGGGGTGVFSTVTHRPSMRRPHGQCPSLHSSSSSSFGVSSSVGSLPFCCLPHLAAYVDQLSGAILKDPAPATATCTPSPAPTTKKEPLQPDPQERERKCETIPMTTTGNYRICEANRIEEMRSEKEEEHLLASPPRRVSLERECTERATIVASTSHEKDPIRIKEEETNAVNTACEFGAPRPSPSPPFQTQRISPERVNDNEELPLPAGRWPRKPEPAPPCLPIPHPTSVVPGSLAKPAKAEEEKEETTIVSRSSRMSMLLPLLRSFSSTQAKGGLQAERGNKVGTAIRDRTPTCPAVGSPLQAPSATTTTPLSQCDASLRRSFRSSSEKGEAIPVQEQGQKGVTDEKPLPLFSMAPFPSPPPLLPFSLEPSLDASSSSDVAPSLSIPMPRAAAVETPAPLRPLSFGSSSTLFSHPIPTLPLPRRRLPLAKTPGVTAVDALTSEQRITRTGAPLEKREKEEETKGQSSSPLLGLVPHRRAGRQGEIIIGPFMAGGACGRVYHCLHTETGKPLAMKELFFDETDPRLPALVHQLAIELEVMYLSTRYPNRGGGRWLQLEKRRRKRKRRTTSRSASSFSRSPPPRGATPAMMVEGEEESGLVEFFCAEKRGHTVWIFMEYCEGGSLLEYYRNRGKEKDSTAKTPKEEETVEESTATKGQQAMNLEPTTELTSSLTPPTLLETLEGQPQRCGGATTTTTTKGLPLGCVQYFTKHITAAIAFLHSHGYAHLDIKPSNILLTRTSPPPPPASFRGHDQWKGEEEEEVETKTAEGTWVSSTWEPSHAPYKAWSVRLADFGSAARLTRRPPSSSCSGATGAAPDSFGSTMAETEPLDQLRGTVWYMAPEMIQMDVTRLGTPADIWSLGCLVMELATGRRPWEHLCGSDPWRLLYLIGSTFSTSPIPTALPLPPALVATPPLPSTRQPSSSASFSTAVFTDAGTRTEGLSFSSSPALPLGSEEVREVETCKTRRRDASLSMTEATNVKEPSSYEAKGSGAEGTERRTHRWTAVAHESTAPFPTTPHDHSFMAPKVGTAIVKKKQRNIKPEEVVGGHLSYPVVQPEDAPASLQHSSSLLSPSFHRNPKREEEEKSTTCRMDALDDRERMEALVDFLRQCIRVQPEDRPTAKALLQHPFLQYSL